MARRRSISTDISLDKKVNAMINKHGYFAGLFYTWLIPHCDDSGEHSADTYKIKLTMFPGLDITTKEIEQAIEALKEFELIKVVDNLILLPLDSFYRHQRYISTKNMEKGYNKRNTIAAQHIGSKPRKVSQIVPSPSPSPSPKKEGSKKPQKSWDDFHQQVKDICREFLKGYIEFEINSGKKKQYSNAEKTNTALRWADDIDKMIRLDGIDPNKIFDIIFWLYDYNAFKANFWRSNIKSGKKLREKYIQLNADRNKDYNTND